MDVILVILIGVIIAFVLADKASGYPECDAPDSKTPPLGSSEPDVNRAALSPSRPLRADAAEVFPIVFDAQEQVVRKTKQISTELLEKVEAGSEAEAYLNGIQENLDADLDAIETNRQTLQSSIDSMPEDHILLVPDFDEFMGAMLDGWLDAMYNQWPVVTMAVDHNEALTPEEREARKGRLALDAITAAIELLDTVKMAGAVSAENTRECIGAFMVDLMSANGGICTGELEFLNKVFSRNWDAQHYFSRYAAKLEDDKAANELVTLMEELGEYNRNMSIFLNRVLQPLICSAIRAGGSSDGRENGKVEAFNVLLQQRLGATGDLQETLKSA